MNKNKANNIRTGLEEWIISIFTILSRLLIGFLVLAVFVMIYKGLSNDAYLIQPFQVPGDFEEKGYNGVVISRKVQDRVKDLKDYVSSTKKDSIAFEADLEPDLEVGVMGFGLSLNTVTFHLKSLLGRKNKIITGELTDLNNKMELTIRMSGYETENHVIEYEENANAALDELLEEAAKTILKNTDPYRLSVYFYNKQEYQKSLELIISLIQKDRDTEWAYLAWGHLLEKQGRQEEANEKFKRALEIKPDFNNALTSLGWNYFGANEPEEATLYFERMIAKDAKSYNGWNGLAQCYRRIGNQEKAIEAYDKSISVAPNQVWGYANKAEYVLQSLKDTAGATILYQTAAEVTKDGMEKYIALAGAYMTMNKMDKMMEYVDKGLEIDPNYSLGNMVKIQVLAMNEEYEEALTYLDRIQAIPVDARGDKLYHKQSSLNQLAMASYHLKKYDQAIVLGKESAAVFPNNGWPYTTIAETYSLMGGKDNEFYHYLEEAFKRGVPSSALMDDAPYQKYLHQKRFIDLVKKYERKKQPLDQVATN